MRRQTDAPPLDRESPVPLYQQLRERIVAQIESGAWAPHEMIPSESDFSKRYGISRATVRQVLSELTHEGLLYRVQGKGTFVGDRKILASPLFYAGLREQLERQGIDTETEVLRMAVIDGPDYLAHAMGISGGEERMHVIERLRSVRGVPISFHRSYLPLRRVPTLNGEELEREQLCVVLERDFSLRRSRMVETLESVRAEGEEAMHLRLSEGEPLLLLKDTLYDAEGEAFEYSEVYFRGDKVKFRFEFSE
ncbi:GntR family transcriptional regulator [Oscillospiraceae bacterium OttesenSCG-928-G22]|nr:GntR family transcriptional regulator [Oscillospiraceae bacterium OttesenSCG-928-G22]